MKGPRRLLGVPPNILYLGLAALPASILAGVLWQAISPAPPFYLGASLAGVAMAGLFFLK